MASQEGHHFRSLRLVLSQPLCRVDPLIHISIFFIFLNHASKATRARMGAFGWPVVRGGDEC